MSVAVVTDSTAYLPVEMVARHHIRVVPLHVVVGGKSHEEGVDISSAQVAAALRAFTPVSTSRPAPAAFAEIYRDLADSGVSEIVSIHISAQMSATISSAELAGNEAAIPVTTVDSESIGMAMGFAVLAAAERAEQGASAAQVAQTARETARMAKTLFYVDTLEHLRRGGRIGKASALLGSALSIKPLLCLRDGHIQPLERVRTSTKALSRLTELTSAAVSEMGGVDGVDIAVHHLDSRERAEALLEQLAQQLPQACRLLLVELGSVVGAHVGPGTVAVSVSPRLSGRQSVLGSGI